MTHNNRFSNSHDRRKSRPSNRPFASQQGNLHRASIENHSSIPDRNDYESRQYAAEPRFSDHDYTRDYNRDSSRNDDRDADTKYNMNDYGSSYLPSNYGRNTSDYGHWTNPDDRRQEQNRESNSSASRASFAGRGPKGYKRADTRIEEEVCDALLHDHVIDASDIEVTVKDGVVTLSGHVPERRMKRLAEDCAEQVSGVNDVLNELLTKSETSSDQTHNSNLERGKMGAMNSSQKSKTGTQSSNVM